MKKIKTNFCFYLTINPVDFHNNFNNTKHIVNLGLQKIEDCPKIYADSSAMILPTLIETFSASYPEAMKMKCPILPSDLDFARDICKDAALYFDPFDAKDIVNKIVELMDNKSLQVDFINKGSFLISEFETSKSRSVKYLNIFKKITNN